MIFDLCDLEHFRFRSPKRALKIFENFKKSQKRAYTPPSITTHVSTLLKPSIPFHTLVPHVDSGDIANEKIRTNDLALEVNKVSIEDALTTKNQNMTI